MGEKRGDDGKKEETAEIWQDNKGEDETKESAKRQREEASTQQVNSQFHLPSRHQVAKLFAKHIKIAEQITVSQSVSIIERQPIRLLRVNHSHEESLLFGKRGNIKDPVKS